MMRDLKQLKSDYETQDDIADFKEWLRHQPEGSAGEQMVYATASGETGRVVDSKRISDAFPREAEIGASIIKEHEARQRRNLASDELLFARLATCRECPQYDDGLCMALGAAAFFVAKTKDRRCPNRAWPSEERPLPSNWSMVKNLFHAAGQAAVSKFKKASMEVREQRYKICQDCDPWFREEDGRCSKCGCYMAFKTLIEAWHCPIAKW